MKLPNLLLGVIALTISTMSFAANEEPIVIKFNHVVAPNTPKGMASDFFAKKAAELTKGKVKVEVYPNSTLYKDKDELYALLENKVQMLAPSMAKFSPLGIKEFEIFDVPFMFSSYEQLDKITKGPVGLELFKKLETKGMLGLGFWGNGFKSFSANSKLINPKDFKGKIFRVQSSKILEEQMFALKARPAIMAFSDVYPALQTGVIDGAENPISNFYTQKMYEVQKHLTISNHGYLGYVVVVNKNFWNGLPKEIKGQLELAMKESTEYELKIVKEQNNKNLESVKSSGKVKIHYLTDSEKIEWKKSLVNVYKTLESRLDKNFVDLFNKEMGR